MLDSDHLIIIQELGLCVALASLFVSYHYETRNKKGPAPIPDTGNRENLNKSRLIFVFGFLGLALSGICNLIIYQDSERARLAAAKSENELNIKIADLTTNQDQLLEQNETIQETARELDIKLTSSTNQIGLLLAQVRGLPATERENILEAIEPMMTNLYGAGPAQNILNHYANTLIVNIPSSQQPSSSRPPTAVPTEPAPTTDLTLIHRGNLPPPSIKTPPATIPPPVFTLPNNATTQTPYTNPGTADTNASNYVAPPSGLTITPLLSVPPTGGAGVGGADTN
jgi:hypothetical protein